MEALEKFMDALSMTYSLKVSKEYYFRGKKNCCIKVEVKRGDEWEYLKYLCYTLKSNGSVNFEEGNTIKSAQEGVLAYLGMDNEIDSYFSMKARVLAKKCLDKSYD